jgi:hypothetical protein
MEFRLQNSGNIAEFRGGESYTDFRKKYRNYCTLETWSYRKWKHGHGDKETWRNVDMEKWRHGDMET